MTRYRRLLVFVVVIVMALSVISMPVSASHVFSDGFEDEPADAGLPVDWDEAVGSDTGYTAEVTTDQANTGTQSFNLSSPAGEFAEVQPDIQPTSPADSNVSYAMRVKESGINGNAMLLESDGGDQLLGVLFDEDNQGNDRLRTRAGTTLTTGVVMGEWITVTIYDMDFDAETYSVTWSSPSDSGTQTGLSMAAGDLGSGYEETIWTVGDGSAQTVSYLDDFSIAGHALEGFVTNPDGDPLKDVNVQVFNTTNPGVIPQTSTTTDATGNWSVDVDPGEWTVRYQNQSYFDAVNETTVTAGETTNLGRQNLTPIPTRYFNADPRGNEYVQNRSAGAFNISIETREPDGQDSQVTSRFMWFNETSGNWEQFNSITWNSEGGTRVTHNFSSPHDWNPGSNQWFVNTTTDRGNFHSSNYTFVTPGNITLVNASDTSQVIDTTTFDVTLTSLDSNFERSEQVTDGKLDLNDIPREDYRVDIKQAVGSDWRDRILIIDDSDISALWTVAMVNDTLFQNQPEWYTQNFTLEDSTGRWEPRETYLLLEQRVDGEFTIITGGLFGFQNNVALDVNDSQDYRTTLLHAVRGDVRRVGTFEADRDKSNEVIVIHVDSLAEPPDQDEGYNIDAFFEGINEEGVTPIIKVTYNDPEDLTFDFEFTIYERGNESNVLIASDGADSLGTATFTYDVSSNETKTSWIVDWEATRDGEPINGTLVVVGERLSPGISILNDNARHGIAFLVILLIGGVVGGGARSDLGSVVSAITGGFFVFIGWMPSIVGMGVVTAALFIAVLFNARIRGQSP